MVESFVLHCGLDHTFRQETRIIILWKSEIKTKDKKKFQTAFKLNEYLIFMLITIRQERQCIHTRLGKLDFCQPLNTSLSYQPTGQEENLKNQEVIGTRSLDRVIIKCNCELTRQRKRLSSLPFTFIACCAHNCYTIHSFVFVLVDSETTPCFICIFLFSGFNIAPDR